MIVLVGGEKGGTGKTTIATNLATMRAKDGRDVLLIDTDTQGSAVMWSQIRSEEGIAPAFTTVSLTGRGVAEEIRKLAPRFQDVVIDSGGRDSVELRQAMLVADVMLIPARPSQFDIHGLAAVDRIVADAQGFNEKLQAYVVINCAPTHAANTDAEDMREVVSEMKTIGLTKAVVRDRVSFRRAAGNGRAVSEYSPLDEKAAFEIDQLYREVFMEKMQ